MGAANRRGPRRGWLLPLGLFIAGGVLALVQVDALLRREYREQGVTQAVQAEALIEGFLQQRIALVNVLQGAISDSRLNDAARGRVLAFTRQIERDAPDIRSVFVLDRDGRVVGAFPETPERRELVGTSFAETPAQHAVLAAARERARATLSGSVTLPLGGEGVMIVAPILDADSDRGFVAASLAYDAAFSGALAGQLRGQFAYRVLDTAGATIASTSAFPAGAGYMVERHVRAGGAPPFRLQVAIPRFQPLAPRLFTIGFGSILLVLVAVIVVREQAQSRRYAERSAQLETLSRNLLEANLRLEERARQVTEANRAKSRFLANVSHELRTPLNAIVGYNALARDGLYGELPSELHDAHHRIGTAADHLLELVDEILDLSRIESGRMEVELESVDLRSVLEGVRTVVEPMVATKRLLFDVHVDRELSRVTTDPRHLRQILLNLAVNAVKFTDHGRVSIRARRGDDGRTMRVEVEDSGVGIAPQDQQRIFEEFEQVRPMGRGDSLQRGTGLGLSIVRKLARLLGGDVTLRSTPGRGSLFEVALPIDGTPSPRNERTSVEVETQSFRQKGRFADGGDERAERIDVRPEVGAEERDYEESGSLDSVQGRG